MKKLYILILLLSITLTGCKNNDVENDDSDKDYFSLSKTETLETFIDVDFSNYLITSVESLQYDNGQADYGYELLTDIDDELLMNIIEISKQFSDYNFSAGITSIIVGEHPELSVHLENGEESIYVGFFKGYPDENSFRLVEFFLNNGEDEYFIIYYSAFPSEFENIYNLVNES